MESSRSIISVEFGFTGSRHGPTAYQMRAFHRFFHAIAWKSPGAQIVINHGDCQGADEGADITSRRFGFVRHIWPSTLEGTRAHTENHGAIQMCPPAHPLMRNMTIVDRSRFIVAAPMDHKPVLRSGTWSTIRYAWKMGKKVFIIGRDGKVINGKI